MPNPRTILATAIIAAFGVSGMTGVRPDRPRPAGPSEPMLNGRMYFDAACAPCHGHDGRGDGPASWNLRTKPRDLTRGVYKNRSTASGQLPTDQDIYRSLTAGIHGTSMPTFVQLDPAVKRALVVYLKQLSPRFSDPEEYPLDTVVLSQTISPSVSSMARGREIYLSMKCAECHGEYGRGDGPAAATQHDDDGRAVATTDLTNRSAYKFASSVRDVYRIFSTGLNGVPMPSYTNSLSNEDRWHLSNYVWAMQNRDQYPVMGAGR
jgi:mono/diheme cytochrome c family protein